MNNLKQNSDKLTKKLLQSTAISFTNDVDEKIIEDILLDWSEAADRLETRALEIEHNIEDQEALKDVKRTLHTLKGDTATFGLYNISGLFHRFEDLLELYIEKKENPFQMLILIVDWLSRILDKIRVGEYDTFDPNDPAASDDSALDESLDWEKNEPSPMKVLVVDDDFTNRILLQEILNTYGTVHVAVNGKEAVKAVSSAIKTNQPYDLACLDIMMPEMDGKKALKKIRSEERKAGIVTGRGMKIIMITAVDDSKSIMSTFKDDCDGYIIKPISRKKLIEQLEKNGLL